MNPDVLCIGVANVDVIAYVDTGFLLRHRVDKDTSTLMRSVDILTMIADLKDPLIIPGGCAANTACGIAAQGIHTSFSGMIHDDAYGTVFRDGFKQYGVDFIAGVHPEKHTALCLTLVTPDKDRSFVFSPDAASWFLSESNLPDRQPGKNLIVYTEANLFRMTAGTTRTSMLHAVLERYSAPDTQIILNLIDTEITIHHRQTLHTLINDRKLSLIISNHEELMALFSTKTIEDALTAAQSTGQIFVTTLGKEGAMIITPDGLEKIKSTGIPMEDVIDTVGAGDQFAAGLVAGLAMGQSMRDSCLNGTRRAAEILGVAGARPKAA